MNYPRCFRKNYSNRAKECSVCSDVDDCSKHICETKIESLLSGPCLMIYQALKNRSLTTVEVDGIVLKAGRRTAYPYIRKLRRMGILNVVCVGRTRLYTLFNNGECNEDRTDSMRVGGLWPKCRSHHSLCRIVVR